MEYRFTVDSEGLEVTAISDDIYNGSTELKIYGEDEAIGRFISALKANYGPYGHFLHEESPTVDIRNFMLDFYGEDFDELQELPKESSEDKL